MHGSLRDVDAADDHGLPPQRWIAHEPLVYDSEPNELHRPARDHAWGRDQLPAVASRRCWCSGVRPRFPAASRIPIIRRQ